jgi:hypothetical protein
MSVITIFMRPGCHLCEEAEQVVVPFAAAAGASVEMIDIESDDELHKRYLELIPVIERDGTEIARLDEFRDGRFDNAFARD